MEAKFKAERDQFYHQLDCFWDRLYGQEYALFDCLELNQGEVEEIRTVTNRVYSLFKKTNQLIRETSDETLLQLGFPSKTIPFLRLQTISYETVIGRFDFVQTNQGLKLLEFNADTPTFIRELFDVNGKVSNQFNLKDPNKGLDEGLGEVIRNAVYQASRLIGQHSHPYVVFTAHVDDMEDRETMKYLMQVAKIDGALFIPLNELIITSEGPKTGVYDPKGKRIDVLYRHTYPLEALINDQTGDGYPIGEAFLHLVKNKKVAMLNPPSAFLMQTKALLALIWGMHEQKHPFYTAEEHQDISSYFLPTYLDEEPLVESGEKYVSKPVFGREGDTVEVKLKGNNIGKQNKYTYDQFLKTYQQHVELPKTLIQTEKGKKEAHLLVGSFIVGERASAMGFRAGAAITDNLSYYLPCGVKGED
ncbi:glutathionylspermidine synthase family protein [Alkalihalophilus lindianensis]|uniref:Glutathionylspermidine synthase family protein n=1 Tax=Alkalihalophilus lindianensis TaxID=1630542 RepID=A0ABU3XBH6_9BACI|nr:glutathionylspermidine synthase family protein [Alkalihalophilus lindianensis]MDV2685230.1 glutathionylspermidine synthase family protein [Alkalihalophilus lindianensis]